MKYISIFVFLACAFFLTPTHAGEIEARAAIINSVKNAFLASDFTRLEELSSSYRKNKQRLPSGVWSLTLFYTGLYMAMPNKSTNEQDYIDYENKISAWEKAYPQSPSAHIAKSSAYLMHADFFRMQDPPDTVSKKAWEPFSKYLKLARANLEEYESIPATDPQWFNLMIKISKLQNWDKPKFTITMNKALKVEPYYYENYFAALDYFLQKWNGDLSEMEDFATQSTKWTEEKDGYGMSARIYWYGIQTRFGNAILSKSIASWPVMKRGFEDVIKYYPDTWNLNSYAKFACLVKDNEKTAELLQKIGKDVVPQAWNAPSWMPTDDANKNLYDLCVTLSKAQ